MKVGSPLLYIFSYLKRVSIFILSGLGESKKGDVLRLNIRTHFRRQWDSDEFSYS